jgi:hypothetical protein
MIISPMAPVGEECMNKPQGGITGMIIIGKTVGEYTSLHHIREPFEHPAGFIFLTSFDEQTGNTDSRIPSPGFAEPVIPGNDLITVAECR